MQPKNLNTWNPEYTPSYTPMEMLDKGVFMDCHYNVAMKGLPSEWYKHKNVYPRDKEPDATKNYYGVKARMSLGHWKEKGWIKTDPLGFWEWGIHYYLGRRLGQEDDWQIGRWKSFVARHQGQIVANCALKDEKCRPKQRQALLQFGWNSTTKFTEEQRQKNLKRFTSKPMIAQESFFTKMPTWVEWE